MIKQNFVVGSAVYLDSGEKPLAHSLGGTAFGLKLAILDEFEIPEIRSPAPSISRPNFDGKVGRFDLVPKTQLGQNITNEGQLTFSDMVAGELLSLQNQNSEVWVELFEETATGTSSGATINDD